MIKVDESIEPTVFRVKGRHNVSGKVLAHLIPTDKCCLFDGREVCITQVRSGECYRCCCGLVIWDAR